VPGLYGFAMGVGRPIRDRLIALLGGKTVGVRIVVERRGEFCLVRHTYGDRRKWVCPGGGIDWREEPEDAARREAAEEAGIDALYDFRLLTTYRHTLNGGDDIVVVFGAKTDQDCRPNSVEIAEAGWFAAEALPERANQRTRELIAMWRAAGM